MSSFLTVLLILVLVLLQVVDSERLMPSLEFTKEACSASSSSSSHDGEESSYGSFFDVCAILEFCTGNGDGQHVDQRLRRRRVQDLFGDLDDSNHNEYQDEQEQQEYYDNGSNGGNNYGSFPEEADWNQQQQDSTNYYSYDNEESSSNGNGESALFGWKIPGSTACTSPGPTMRLTRGLHHGLFVRGVNGVVTNLHFHGLHISGYEDDIRRRVEGTDGFTIYSLRLDQQQHMGGTYWYHPHWMGTSWEQTKGGAFGMIVIADGDNVGTTDRNVLGFLENEKLLVLDNAKDDSTWRANGVAASSVEAAYTLNTDEWYRLRVLMVNVGSQATGGLLTFDDGCEVRPIAHDGIFRMQVPGNVQMEYHLTSSSRLDVAIKCQSDSGIRVDGATVATVSVTGQGDATLTPFDSSTDQPWKTTRLDYVADLCRPEVIVDAYWNVRVDETNINGQSYDIDYPLCNDENDFDYGTIQEWSIEGADTHPFHLHMYPMQVVGDCGIAHEVGEYYDTIVSAGSAHSTCQVRIRLVDVAGPAVMHCHIFEHAEQGAMGYINVVGGPEPTTTDVPRCSSSAACQDVATNVVVKCSGSHE